MSGRFPHNWNDLVDGSDRWRLRIERGMIGGVRSFTILLHDQGHFNGGQAAWYSAGEAHALELGDETETANLLLDLLDSGFLDAPREHEQLAVELLHRNGYRVPAEALIRIYGEEEARAAIASWEAHDA